MLYCRFAADVVHLGKLSVGHVGAHLRCKISCKYIAIFTMHSDNYFVLWIFLVKKSKISRKYSRIPVLSNYAGGLESHVRERYLKKISVVDVDPVQAGSLTQKNLPPIAVSDLLSYSVLETSYYANSSLKHLKVLKRSTKWCLAS